MLELSLVMVIAASASAVWVYLDASKHEIGKISGSSGMFNMPAGVWGIVTLLLWVIGFPAYLIKRSELIEKAKQSAVAVSGRTGKAAALGAVGGLLILASLGAQRSGDLPSCNAPSVVALAEQSIFANRMAGVQIKGISRPAERSYDAASQTRVCRARLSSDLGEESVSYSVKWNDQSKGYIRVQILD